MVTQGAVGVRILVTGGSGFIGGHLCDRLAYDGHEVIILDNLSTGRDENIHNLTQRGAVHLIVGDVRSRQLALKAMRDIDAVVHLAAIISVPFSVSHPALTNQVNVTGTLNVLEAARRCNVSKFIYASSCAVYGEARYLPIDEVHPENPLSPYAASKLCSEAYCAAFRNAYGLDTTVLRLFNVYGPRQEGNPYAGVIVQFQQRLSEGKPPVIYGDGQQTRDFVHVSDAVEAIVRCLNDDRASGRTLNIGSGRSTSISHLANLMLSFSQSDLRPIHLEPRPGDIRHSQAGISRARAEISYEPKIRIEEGIRPLLAIPGEASQESSGQ